MGKRETEAPQPYVALLRGINLGDKNKLPMKDLVAIFSAAGCSDVQTYIQSGNVVFRAAAGLAASLAGRISSDVAKRLGLSIPVVLRTASQLAETLDNNPFLALGAPEGTLHVMFLASQPAAGAVAGLDPDRSPGDTFAVRGREIYLRLPNGVAPSKLTNAYFDAKLSTTSTARNWRTVTKLYELAAALAR